MSARLAISYGFARDHGIILTGGDNPVFLVRDNANPLMLLEARRVAGQDWPIRKVSAKEFDQVISDVYAYSDIDPVMDEGDTGDDETSLAKLIDDIPRTEDLLDSTSDAPIIKLINGLIAEAVRQSVSDIHIEPYEDRVSIRFRIDGVLKERASLAQRVASPLVSRIKVMSRLDIAEKRIPQDGRLTLTLGKRGVDIRVSTLPSRYGERVVMRLLDKDSARFNLEDLGMEAQALSDFKSAISQPNGIVLVTGPTGAGKTTTLYAALNRLNDSSRNILTVEDPVEYAVEGVGQTQVNTKVGMTFAASLRAILRQDPDVVMVGEIRDVETAEIAIQASLTGHLVLSTVHTNSAVAAVARLRDMGAESYLLASTLSAVVAQRLVRRLCPACKQPCQPSQTELDLFKSISIQPEQLYNPVGCEHCQELGYVGRHGVYEVLVVDETIRGLIHDNARESELNQHGFKDRDTLYQAGLKLAASGTTTLSEVLRVCREDGDRGDHHARL